jgi:hypothetical protein
LAELQDWHFSAEQAVHFPSFKTNPSGQMLQEVQLLTGAHKVPLSE